MEFWQERYKQSNTCQPGLPVNEAELNKIPYLFLA